MATHSSILAWEIPWPEEPGGLYSPWSRRESDMTEQHTHTHFSSNKKLNSNSQLVKTKNKQIHQVFLFLSKFSKLLILITLHWGVFLSLRKKVN